jgi:hypothetical protein
LIFKFFYFRTLQSRNETEKLKNIVPFFPLLLVSIHIYNLFIFKFVMQIW